MLPCVVRHLYCYLEVSYANKFVLVFRGELPPLELPPPPPLPLPNKKINNIKDIQRQIRKK